ncbi:MAG: tautomerase family protein [Bacillota bacterium]
MPVVKIEWLEGRSRETKAKVAEVIEKAMIEHAGCQPGATYIVFEDVKKENWAINGKLMG